MAHGERTKAILLTAISDAFEVASYAIHLTAAVSSSSAASSVKLRYCNTYMLTWNLLHITVIN